MAEIEIEKKKPVWPWILLIVVILVILGIFIFNDDEVIEDELYDTEQIENNYDDGADGTTFHTAKSNEILVG